MVKNLPAEAGDMSPSSWSWKIPHAEALLSLCSGAQKSQPPRPRAGLPEPVLPNKRRPHDEKPAYHNTECPPLATTRESLCSDVDSAQPKIKINAI